MDGTLIADIIPSLRKASFIGINCISATIIEAEVAHLRSLLPSTMRIIAYGNVGLVDDVKGWINTDAIDPKVFAEYVTKWIDAGASLVGSCCGTTPDTIRAIHQHCFSPKQAKLAEKTPEPMPVKEDEERKQTIAIMQVFIIFITLSMALALMLDSNVKGTSTNTEL